MGFSEDAALLTQSFGKTKTLLEQLLAALEERRTAWVSVRPDVLTPSSDVERISQQLATEEDGRAAIIRRIRVALPTPIGKNPDKLHVNVTRIAAALPTDAGRALRKAADEVQPLAKKVRTEVTLGQRLLRFAQHAQSNMDAEVTGITTTTRAPGYNRQARELAVTNTAGQLVDGRA